MIKIFNHWELGSSVVFLVTPSKQTASLQSGKPTQVFSVLNKNSPSINISFYFSIFASPLVPSLLFSF
jgi:hypothetical protein